MSKLESYYGKETRVFITTYLRGDGSLEIVELQTPLRQSINEYLKDCGKGFIPIHVYLKPVDGYIFEDALDRIRKRSIHSTQKRLCKIYINILKEQDINVKAELLIASNEITDDAARDYLQKFNLTLRQHLENFPTHYNNPIRLPNQKGALRKPKNIGPVNAFWPNS